MKRESKSATLLGNTYRITTKFCKHCMYVSGQRSRKSSRLSRVDRIEQLRGEQLPPAISMLLFCPKSWAPTLLRHTLVTPPPRPQWHHTCADCFCCKFAFVFSSSNKVSTILGGEISLKTWKPIQLVGECFTLSWALRCDGSWSSTRRCTPCTTPWSPARWPWGTNTVRHNDACRWKP